MARRSGALGVRGHAEAQPQALTPPIPLFFLNVFFFFFILSFFSLFPFLYNTLLALIHWISFYLPTLPGCSLDLFLFHFFWRPIKEGVEQAHPRAQRQGGSTRAGASCPTRCMVEGHEREKLQPGSL